MVIYHGSEKIIKKPEYGKGKSTNDYGRGFYCTESIEMAKEWACGNGNDGYANFYELNMQGLTLLDLNSSQYSILNWLAVLTVNRTYWENGAISREAKDYLHSHFYIDISKYDVIKGYRADDSYFTFAKNFVAGTISVRKLNQAMHLGRLGQQIVLKSREAFSRITFKGFEDAPANMYYQRKQARDINARREYRKTRSDADTMDDIYMIDIMRGGIDNADPRLRSGIS